MIQDPLVKYSSTLQQKLEEAIELYLNPNSPESLIRWVNESQAYIYTPDTDDIRSEGQSYGMYVATQIKNQNLFDALWNFAKEFQLNKEGEVEGLFAWQLEAKAPFNKMDQNPAPDGELYYAEALLKAHEIWGSEGKSNYLNDAHEIMDAMLDQKESETFRPFFDLKQMQVVFTTDKDCAPFTDPSYHLPHFLTHFAHYARTQLEKKLWEDLAQSSREFLSQAAYPTTGLYSDYSAWDGSPQPTSFNPNSHLAGMDSIRVVMNLCMDFKNHNMKQWENILANQSAHFKKEGSVSVQTLEGEPKVDWFNEGHIACLAHLALWDEQEGEFHLKRFLETPLPKGTFRYYSGMLTLIALGHLTN